ncbi:hypothetical protein D3C85_1006160 [compost metagenome]
MLRLDAIAHQQTGPALAGGRAQIVLGLGQGIVGRKMQQLDAAAFFQGHAQRQEQAPVMCPFTVATEVRGPFEGQVACSQKRFQRFRVALGHMADIGKQLVIVAYDPDTGGRVAVTPNTLAQVVLHGLFQAPVAVADHPAIIGVGEQAGDALLVAQGDAGVCSCHAGKGQGEQGSADQRKQRCFCHG